MKKIQKIILAFMLGIVPIQSALADSKADALVNAALNGKLEQVKTLIEKEGVDINARETETKLDLTALMTASGEGYLEVVKYLISKGADINAKDNSGITALMWASVKGQLEVVKYLIDKGADINAKDNNGNTALMVASMKGQLEVVQYLIDKGADINAKIDNGRTALIMASQQGHLEVVKYLLSKGANVNAVATIQEKGVAYNLTALDYAKIDKRHKAAEVLKNAGAKTAKEIQK